MDGPNCSHLESIVLVRTEVFELGEFVCDCKHWLPVRDPGVLRNPIQNLSARDYRRVTELGTMIKA